MITNSRSAPLTILITDAHELAGLGAIRSLGRAGYRVVGGYPEGRAVPPAIRSRYCAAGITYPDPWMQQIAFREWLLREAGRSTFDAVMPVAESAVAAVAAVRGELPPGVLPLLASDAPLRCALSKYHATARALAAGVVCPRTVFVQDGTAGGSCQDDLSELRFPIIVKTDNHLSADGVYVRGRKHVVRHADAAADVLEEYKGRPIAVIAQEFIPGTGAGAFFLRFGGEIHMTFAHRRLHEIPYTGGYSSYRESSAEPELTQLGARVLDATGHDGVAMVEFRRASADGQPYFLEINGRMWGSIALALHAGADFPRAWLECLEHGRPAAHAPARIGVRCRNVFPGEVKHVRSILAAKPGPADPHPPSKAGALARFVALTLNPAIHHDHLWLADPLPGVANAVRALRWIASETRAAARERVRRRREEQRLEQMRARHAERLRSGSYFDAPLSRIGFVCLGNICRSPFAERYWTRRLAERGLTAPQASSFGFYPRPDRRSPRWLAAIADSFSVDLRPHRSRAIDERAVRELDAIFVMDRRNYADMVARYPWAEDKIYFLGWFAGRPEIKDPYVMAPAEAATVLREMSEAVDALMAAIAGPPPSAATNAAPAQSATLTTERAI